MFDTLLGNVCVAVGLLAGLLVSLEVGFWLGTRARAARDVADEAQTLAIEAALLGLLGLLLGFSFAGAATRYMERQDQIVQEANAIGTAYLRADVLDEPQAADLRRTLAAYVHHRIANWKGLIKGDKEAIAKQEELQARLWSAARDGVNARPQTMLVVLNPVNEVIDLHSTRLAASQKHLPALVLVVLLICSGLGMVVIGYGCGVHGRRNLPMAVSLAVLIAAAMWTTIDMDNPRAGLIRLSDAPLEALHLEAK